MGDAISKDPERAAAWNAYMEAQWSLYDIEVLSHHFCCSSIPFPMEDAPAYPYTVEKLRAAELIDTDRVVTAKGIRFIAALCATPVPSPSSEGRG